MTQQPDPWSTPAKPGDAVYPSLKQLGGRLLVLEPTRLEENVPDIYNAGKTKDRMTCDVTFLDGDTLTVSLDRDDRPTPLPHPIAAGETMSSMFISQTVLVTQLKQAMRDRGGSGMVLGRLVKGEARGGNNAPWLLTDPSEQDKDTARRWYAWRISQQASAAMQPPAAPAPQQAPAQQYAAPAPAPPQAPAQPPQQAAPAWGAPQQQAPAVGGPNIDPSPAF